MKKGLVLAFISFCLASCGGSKNSGNGGEGKPDGNGIIEASFQLDSVRSASLDEVIQIAQSNIASTTRLELGDHYRSVIDSSTQIDDGSGNLKDCVYKSSEEFTIVEVSSDEFKVLESVTDDFSAGNCKELGVSDYERVSVRKISEELDISFDPNDIPAGTQFSIGRKGNQSFFQISASMNFNGTTYNILAIQEFTRPLWASTNFSKTKDSSGKIIMQEAASSVENIDISGLNWQSLPQIRRSYED